MLDRGFYSVRVIHDLITGGVALHHARGQTREKAHHSGRPHRHLCTGGNETSHWTSYTLKSAQEGHVDFDLAVVCHNTRGQRGRHQREALLYATWGVTHRPLSWIRATYRRRFGIESSYRQSHQARIRTSSRKPALRLLFMGVALVLRNVWVWLHAEVMAQPQRGARQLRPQSLRFARVLLWLLMEVARHYRLLRNIPVYHDLYERAHVFGIVFNY